MLVSKCKLFRFFHAVCFPVVGEFVARILPAHALLNPLVAAPELFPVLAGTVETLLRVGYFLHTLVADPGEPLLERLGFGRRHRLDQPQQLLGVGYVGSVHFPIGSAIFSCPIFSDS
jgi:hypothetical protein